MLDQIMDFLDKFAPLLYVVVPAIAGIYLKLSKKIMQKKSDIEKQNIQKRKDIFDTWIHTESRETIKKLRDLCNLYKDKTHVDLVHYLQLENGTLATSKIHNMFISCLAEDNRFGRLPKIIADIQRIPYNNFVDFLGEIDYTDSKNYIGVCPESKIELVHLPFLCNDVRSYLYISIRDMHNTIIGVGVFMYADLNYNGQDIEDQKNYLRQMQAGMEAIFFDFQMNRSRKQRELFLEESDI